jgi:hypothetical protein
MVEPEARYQARWGRYDDVRWVPYLRHLLATGEHLPAGYRARPLEAMGLTEEELFPVRWAREDNEREVADIRRRLRELGAAVEGGPVGERPG